MELNVFVARDRAWDQRKFGSIEAYRVMRNQMLRDAESLKAAIPKRVASAKRSMNVPAGTNVP